MKNFLGICFLSLLLLEAVRGQNNNERNNNKCNRPRHIYKVSKW